MPRRIAVIPVLLVLPLLVGLAAVPAHAARNLWRQMPTWNIAHQGGEDELPSTPSAKRWPPARTCSSWTSA